jgi:hypothetical protein
MNFVLPPKSRATTLSPEIAGEGVAVNLDNGFDVNWQPPPKNLVMPDMSQIKSIQKYFNRSNFPDFPAWIYHKDTDEKHLVTEDQAEAYGIYFRETTSDEKARFGKDKVWDWDAESPWRPTPNSRHIKFNATKGGTGKIVVHPQSGPSQETSIDKIVASVMAAVIAKSSSEEVSVEKMATAIAMAFKSVGFERPERASDGGELNAREISADQDREIWIEEAEQRGVKIDKRWSTEKIKEAIAKAA